MMLTKCYPTSQGCSCDFQRLKVGPFGIPKPFRRFSKDASSLLIKSKFSILLIIVNRTKKLNINIVIIYKILNVAYVFLEQ